MSTTGVVKQGDIAPGAVVSESIAPNAVTSEHLAPGAVVASDVADGSITTAKLATNAVTTVKITDVNVTTAKIADLNVTTGKIADLGVTAGKIAADAVITVKILDANVTTPKIADAAITVAKTGFDNYVVSGLFVIEKGTPDLNLRVSEGLVKVSTTVKYRLAVTADGLAITAATAAKEKVAIVQISNAGVLSVKDGAEVNAGAGTATYPAPDANNIMIAKLFTPGVPIINATTAVANANIDNTARTIA